MKQWCPLYIFLYSRIYDSAKASSESVVKQAAVGLEPMSACPYRSSANIGTNHLINILIPRQNGRHFPDDIFKCILLYENVHISHKSSVKIAPKVRIDSI